jgi:hypothetical protein
MATSCEIWRLNEHQKEPSFESKMSKSHLTNDEPLCFTRVGRFISSVEADSKNQSLGPKRGVLMAVHARWRFKPGCINI